MQKDQDTDLSKDEIIGHLTANSKNYQKNLRRINDLLILHYDYFENSDPFELIELLRCNYLLIAELKALKKAK